MYQPRRSRMRKAAVEHAGHWILATWLVEADEAQECKTKGVV